MSNPLELRCSYWEPTRSWMAAVYEDGEAKHPLVTSGHPAPEAAIAALAHVSINYIHVLELRSATDRPEEVAGTQPDGSRGLIETLQHLGDLYGPMGVALFAASLTDRGALIKRLEWDMTQLPNLEGK